jgi:anti-sigma B factor antagonist
MSCDGFSPAGFSFVVVAKADQIRVKLFGELDVAECPQLRDAFALIAEDVGCDLTVDLDGLTYLDSTGISVLVMTCKRIRAQGGTFALANATDEVSMILEVTGLVDFFHLDRDSDNPSATITA